MMRAFPLHTPALLVTLAAVAASGCGRSVSVQWWEAPPADIGAASTVVVTDAYGRGDAVDAVAQTTRDHILAHGYFNAADRQHRERLEISRRGDAWLDTGAAMQPDTIYVRVDVLEHSALTADTFTQDPDTGETVVASSMTTAHVVLSVTAADTHGLLLDEVEVEGVAERDGFVDDGDVVVLLDQAAAAAVAEGVRDLLPVRRTDRIPLDDRDSALHDVLDADVSVDAKLELVDRFVAKHPDHTGALYNRAALKDARGDYEGALIDYDAALDRAHDDSMYAESRAACEDRRTAARALGR